jgi:hypothetical protein
MNILNFWAIILPPIEIFSRRLGILKCAPRRFQASHLHYFLLTVPPLVWNGFKGIGDKTAIVANCATLPHDPDEIERKTAFDPSIPYDWNIKHK